MSVGQEGDNMPHKILTDPNSALEGSSVTIAPVSAVDTQLHSLLARMEERVSNMAQGMATKSELAAIDTKLSDLKADKSSRTEHEAVTKMLEAFQLDRKEDRKVLDDFRVSFSHVPMSIDKLETQTRDLARIASTIDKLDDRTKGIITDKELRPVRTAAYSACGFIGTVCAMLIGVVLLSPYEEGLSGGDLLGPDSHYPGALNPGTPAPPTPESGYHSHQSKTTTEGYQPPVAAGKPESFDLRLHGDHRRPVVDYSAIPGQLQAPSSELYPGSG